MAPVGLIGQIPRLGRHQGGGRVAVVQQRRGAREALGAHQLLGVQPTVGTAELGVALLGHVSDGSVMRHLHSHPDRASDYRTVL